MGTVHENLSEQFYAWERRGRGWHVFDEPVSLEPPFKPFLGHCLPATAVVDDGRRPTILSSLMSGLSRKLRGQGSEESEISEIEEEPVPEALVRGPLVELQTSLPAELDLPREAFEQFLSSLSLCREPVSFELLGVSQSVTAQFAIHPKDAPIVRRQLNAYFPDAVFRTRQEALENSWKSSIGDYALAVEFGLEREIMFSLASGKLDPFVGIIGAIAEMRPGELALFQVLFQPVVNDWAESIMRSVTHADGKPFFVNRPDLASAAENKVARPLYAAVVRILVKTGQYERTLQISQDIAGAMRVFIHPQENALVPLDNDQYPFDDHITDVIHRQSRRSGMILSLDELIGFVHLPSSAVRSSVLLRQISKTKAAPAIVCQSNGLLLGNNFHADECLSVRLNAEQRVRHTHIIGASGTGKSTLLFNLIMQDIENGAGVGVLDPHGDLVDRILGAIPKNRIDDVVLVDPSDTEYSVGFNILFAHSDLEKKLLASDLVSVFERLCTSWGDQMGSVLQKSILAFLESSRRGTLVDLRRFLIEPLFRSEFLKSVQDPNVVYYWKKVFPLLSGNKSMGSVLTRLETFLDEKQIRHMVSQPENRLDFAHIMDSGKIFLARLPEGLVGEKDSFLLGTLLICKFQQLAMSRQAQVASTRKDFWLYIDEFDNFITPTMAQILKGTRKYRLGLTLAHQELHQLHRDAAVESAVMTHPHTRIVFNVGDDDARKLADGFSYFEARDVKSLGTFQSLARVQRSDYDFNLSVLPPVKIDESAAALRRAEVTTASRRKYATPRAEVEAAERGNWEQAPSESALAKSPPTSARSSEKRNDSEVPKFSEPSIASQPSEVKAIAPKVEDPKHGDIKRKIRDEAESLEYTVSPEEHFPAIQSRVDVVLRRSRQFIAGQVISTNHVDNEIESVRKLLKLDFTHIALISIHQKKLSSIKQIFSETGENVERVGFYSPEQFISKLFEWAAADPEGGKAERNKPHKQKLDLASGSLTKAEQEEKREKMLEELKRRMKRDKPT